MEIWMGYVNNTLWVSPKMRNLPQNIYVNWKIMRIQWIRAVHPLRGLVWQQFWLRDMPSGKRFQNEQENHHVPWENSFELSSMTIFKFANCWHNQRVSGAGMQDLMVVEFLTGIVANGLMHLKIGPEGSWRTTLHRYNMRNFPHVYKQMPMFSEQDFRCEGDCA